MNQSNNISIGNSAIIFLLTAIILWLKCKWFAMWCLSFLDANYDYSQLAQNLAISAASLIISSIVWLSKRPWFGIVLMIIIDLWIIANIIYFRANHLLITYSAIAMCSNMDGFQQAILAYVDWRIYLFPAITVAYAVLSVWLSPTNRHPFAFGGTVLIAIACSIIASSIRCKHGGVNNMWLVDEPIPWQEKYNPFITPTNLLPEQWKMELTELNYTYHHSIIAYGVDVLTTGHKRYSELIQNQNNIKLTPEEQNILDSLILNKENILSQTTIPDNLLIIIVESWESWVFNHKDLDGQYVMPKIQQIMREHPYLLANKVTPQVRHGVSADGQMIINTGLLPLIDGAACMLYGENSYPNLSHFYSSSANIDACNRAWNGNVTSKSYHYQQHLAPQDESWWMENTTAPLAKDFILNHKQSACVQVITIGSHSPFCFIPESEYLHTLHFADSVDELSSRYMQSINWMDYHIGTLLEKLDTDGLFNNTTIVMTGDHTFHREGEYYCPLLIFSPNIQNTKTINDIVYQMDVYPTILSLIGQSNHYWNGFGIDLSSDTQSRAISIEQASLISDKLIRMNYFSKLNNDNR